jgi:hypothetical protein
MIIDTYVYFVSYNIKLEDGWGFGNCVVTIENELKGYKDIEDVEKYIIADNEKSLRLINFQLLDSYNKEEREKV